MSAAETLIERLRRRAKEDKACADNSAVIVDALAGQMKLFDAHEVRADGQVWNTYAVRMAVDHKNSVRRDTQYANDLTEAADALAAKDAALSEMAERLAERLSAWEEQARVEAKRADAMAYGWEAEKAENERLKLALTVADEAIAEYIRYLDGGEMRGSYDGRPERDKLRKSGYVVRTARSLLKEGDTNG